MQLSTFLKRGGCTNPQDLVFTGKGKEEGNKAKSGHNY